MDQKLIATIVPKWDQTALNELSQALSSTISSASSISQNTSTTQSTSNTATASSDTSSNSGGNLEEITRTAKQQMNAYAESDGLTKMIDKVGKFFSNLFGPNEYGTEGLSKSTTAIFGSVKEFLPYLAVGAAAVGSLFKLLESVVDRLRSASPMLNTIMSLIEMTFNMIFLPIGTILGQRLIPMLLDTWGLIADWFSKAWKLYDEEGWAGIIVGAFDVIVEMIKIVLKDSIKLLWDVFIETVVGLFVYWFNGFMDLIGYDFSLDFKSLIELVKKYTDIIAQIMGWLIDIGAEALQAIIGGLTAIVGGPLTAIITYQASLMGLIVDFIQNTFTPEFFASIVSILAQILNYVVNLVRNVSAQMIMNLIKTVSDLVTTFGDFVTKTFTPEKLQQMLSSLSNMSLTISTALTGALKSLFGEDFVNKFKDMANSVVSWASSMKGEDGSWNLSKVISDAVQWVLDSLYSIVEKASEDDGVFGGIFKSVKSIWDAVKKIDWSKFFTDMLEMMAKLIAFLNKFDLNINVPGIDSFTTSILGTSSPDIFQMSIDAWNEVLSGKNPYDEGGSMHGFVEAGQAVARGFLGALGIEVFGKGGVVSQPTLALIGESGPEAIVPLNNSDYSGKTEITNNWYISGVSEEKLISTIRREVSSISSLAKTRTGF